MNRGWPSNNWPRRLPSTRDPTGDGRPGGSAMTTRNRTTAVYVISVAAELAGMHPQTLRIYERRGLVNPARTRGGNRRYSDADIETLQRIAQLAEQGMNLEGIRRVMELEYENALLRDELHSARLVAERATLDA